MAGRKRSNASRDARERPPPDWFGGTEGRGGRDGRVNLDQRAPWLERHGGPIAFLLFCFAKDLRASKTKAQRLELAAALDQLSQEIQRRRPVSKRRGRPPKNGASIWRFVALVRALMEREKVSQGLAVRAVCTDPNGVLDEKGKQYLERALRRLNAGDAQPRFALSFHEWGYEIVRRRLPPRIHRTK